MLPSRVAGCSFTARTGNLSSGSWSCSSSPSLFPQLLLTRVLSRLSTTGRGCCRRGLVRSSWGGWGLAGGRETSLPSLFIRERLAGARRWGQSWACSSGDAGTAAHHCSAPRALPTPRRCLQPAPSLSLLSQWPVASPRARRHRVTRGRASGQELRSVGGACQSRSVPSASLWVVTLPSSDEVQRVGLPVFPLAEEPPA